MIDLDIVAALGPFRRGHPVWLNNELTRPVEQPMISHNGPILPNQYAIFDFSIEDGNNFTATWDFGDGSGESRFAPYHLYDQAGIYTIGLTLTNELGSHHVARQLEVTTAITPSVELQHPEYEMPFAVVPFAAEIFGGGIASWSFGDGNFAFGRIANHVYAAPGVYTVTLFLENEFGGPYTSRITVTTSLLTGLMVDAPTRLLVGETGQFTATVQTGIPLTVSWDMGDGTLLAGGVTTHSYKAVGIYPITVTVSDGVITLMESLSVEVVPVAVLHLPVLFAAPPPD